MLLNLFVGLVFQGFGIAVVNPSRLADVDLNPAVFLLALAEISALLVGIDYPVHELNRVLRQALVERRELAGRKNSRKTQKAFAAASLNRLLDQLGAAFGVFGVVRIGLLRVRRDRDQQRDYADPCQFKY